MGHLGYILDGATCAIVCFNVVSSSCQSHINLAKRSDLESMAFSLEQSLMEASAFFRRDAERAEQSSRLPLPKSALNSR